MHNAVVVQAGCRLIVEVLILRYVLGALVEKSRIQNDVGHEFNHLLLLQLRCNFGTEINFHWPGPRTSLASTLSLHRFFFVRYRKTYLLRFGISLIVYIIFSHNFQLFYWQSTILFICNNTILMPIVCLTNWCATLDLPTSRLPKIGLIGYSTRL